MTDDGIGLILIFIEEISNAREGNLIDVFVNFLLCHSDSMVTDSERTLVFIEEDLNLQVVCIAFEVTLLSKSLQLLRSIHSVGNHLAKENFMV